MKRPRHLLPFVNFNVVSHNILLLPANAISIALPNYVRKFLHAIIFKKAIVPKKSHQTQLVIERLGFTGDEMPGCLNGGLAIFGVVDTNKFAKKQLLCNKNEDILQNLQTLYTDSKLVVVRYAFPNYSTVQVSISISYVTCNVITIDACNWKSWNPAQWCPAGFVDCDIKVSNYVGFNMDLSSCSIAQIFADQFRKCKTKACDVFFEIDINTLKNNLLNI